jgi:hypothetical protein
VKAKKRKLPFNVEAFLSTVDGGRTVSKYGPGCVKTLRAD